MEPSNEDIKEAKQKDIETVNTIMSNLIRDYVNCHVIKGYEASIVLPETGLHITISIAG